MANNSTFEKEQLSKRAFAIIELLEVAGVNETSFSIIRKRLLDLGNDILRLDNKEGDIKCPHLLK